MKKKILFLMFFICSAFIFAEATPVKGLSAYKLNNGLELYVAENHTVPLVYIEVTVKCGGYTQTPETAGLFHLYEHMMFKGNSRYKTAAAFSKAINDLGVTSHNGSTGIEWVNYYFTVPSDKLEKGLEFWSYAIRSPLLTEKELEDEKKVVISEIQSDLTEPGNVFFKKKTDLLYPDGPWTLSPGGTIEAVKKATVNQLKEIQQKYYIPNNSAVFVGGDVDSEKAFKLVKKVFGSWKKGNDPFTDGEKSVLVHHEKNPLSKPALRVMPYDRMSPEMCEVYIEYRGPDAAYEEKDTYTADMLFNCAANPDSSFKTFFTDECKIGVPDKEYLGAGYQTYRTCGSIVFSAEILSDSGSISENALKFYKNIVPAIKKTIQTQTEESLSIVRQRLKDDRIFMMETSDSLLSTLRYYWGTASAYYFYTYNDRLSEVTSEEMEKFTENYIEKINPVVFVLINPDLYESRKTEFKNAGFEEVKMDLAGKVTK